MNLKILAIDTSSKVCSVAITEDTNKIIELENDDEKTHSVKLMPMVDEAFNKSGLSLNDIDLFCKYFPKKLSIFIKIYSINIK